jgi:UDP-glucose-4-epimerase GalE
MTVLVTGGAGYIGSHTVLELLRRKQKVVALDSLVRGSEAFVPSSVPLEIVDVCNAESVRDVCERHAITTVIHFAAFKSVGESMEQPYLYWRNNVFGTIQLIEGMLSAKVKRLIFSSSASVYGIPGQLPIRESSPISPTNVYAETKAMCEKLISWYSRTSDLRWVSLRYFNAAGASTTGRLGENWDHSANLIPQIMKASLLPGHAIDIFGTDYPTPDGTCIRDYIHVDDLATAHVAAVDFLDQDNGNIALNLGTGIGHSVMEVLRIVESITGRKIPTRFGGRREGDPPSVYADPTLASETLGWKAQFSIEDIVKSAFKWHSGRINGHS